MKSAAKRILELRALGYKINVRQMRVINNKGRLFGMYTKHDIAQLREQEPNISVHPRGGRTWVTITTPDGFEVEGHARCRTDDPNRTTPGDCFNKKVGLSIALGRAEKLIHEHEHSSTQHQLSLNGAATQESTAEFNLTGHGSDGTAQ